MAKELPLRRCLVLFSLRQGTIIVGYLVLLLSGICLFLLMSGSEHAHEIAKMLEADIEISAEREGIVLSEDNEIRSQNEIVLQKAHSLATVVVMWIYNGVAVAVVHVFFCLLLLYGAIMRVRQLLVPWIYMALIGLIMFCTAMLVSMYLLRGIQALIIFVFSSAAISLGFYMWLVVYSHYLELCNWNKGCPNARTHVTLARLNLSNTTNL